MSYCKSCGAYIPDGQTKCLACGYDEIEEQEKAAAEAQSAAQTQSEPRRFGGMSSEELRRELERQRAKRQEENRRWAKEEQEKRARSAQAAARENSTGYNTPSSDGGQKLFAAASYISVLFILPYIFCGNSEFAKFHAKQGLGLFVFGAIADIVGAIFPVAWLLWLVRIYCAFKGITTALDGRMDKLPIVGKYIK